MIKSIYTNTSKELKNILLLALLALLALTIERSIVAPVIIIGLRIISELIATPIVKKIIGDKKESAKVEIFGMSMKAIALVLVVVIMLLRIITMPILYVAAVVLGIIAPFSKIPASKQEVQ